ncbi:MAG TPA: diguanylate cyclase, partial [candidate division WOR-3 bacterium]|nr:diguanylate cyclase [candidate division WOR-3 bacterium]
MQKNENFNIIDELTGLYNRRYLFLRLDEEIKRAKRKDGVFSLFLLDLDYFKM